VGDLVALLLNSCPRLRILATSRQALGAVGEVTWPVSLLSVPDLSSPPTIAQLEGYDAIRLFVDRARQRNPAFALRTENAQAVAQICARLEGLPLAIELAAARTKMLPPQALLGRLEDRLKLLTGGSRELSERQRTLRSTIEWSYELLEEEEQVLFRRLSVFAGGRTLEAIEAICDAKGDLPVDSLEGVSSLLEKSLLRREGSPDSEPRFVMLETIHEYAREKLEVSGEAEEIKRAHAEYFLALAEEAEPELKGPDQLEWLERSGTEHDNFRVALSWLLDGGDTELALQLAGALWWFWYVRGHLSEGLRWLEEVLAKDGRAATLEPARAKVLTGTGRLTLDQGDLEGGTALLEESVALFREVDQDMQGLADAVDNLGIARAFQGELEQAKALFEESLELYREVGDRWGIAETLNNLGNIAQMQGGIDRATVVHEESLKVRREVGDTRGIMMSLNNLALLALHNRNFERAEVMLEEVLRLAREVGDMTFLSSALEDLGMVALELGDLERAGTRLRESLLIGREIGGIWLILSVLIYLASVAVARGARERAARLWGAAEGLSEATGLSLAAAVNLRLYERYLATARAELGEAAWEEAYAEGQAMTLEEAVSYALEEGIPICPRALQQGNPQLGRRSSSSAAARKR
jgi:predicted ATPase